MNNTQIRRRKSATIVAQSIALCLLGSAAHTQSYAQSHSFHGDDAEIEEIVIKAHPLHKEGLAQSVEVLNGQELLEALESNLGDTLAKQPGIRSASFGAAVGRPVIHGLGGPRVKTTEDQIDTLDVSVTSTDHAVTVEPFIADQITVLKGASTLLFGSGAIGGVVDTQTGRVPTQRIGAPITGRAELRFGDNGDSEIGAIRLDGDIGDNENSSLAWHLDAFSKQADDYEIPEPAESAILRALEEAEGEEHEEEEDTGEVLGSRYDLQGLAAGFSWVGNRGHIGASVSTSEGIYGLVGGHEEEEEEGEEEHEDELAELEEAPGVIDFEQTRVDFSAELLDPFAGFKSLSLRVGANDYQHLEIEGNGEVGTRFDNDAWEAQIQAQHEAILGFEGVFGLQLGDREFSAIGEEAFVPPAETQKTGIYWVSERNFDSFSLELGARFDDLTTKPLNSSEFERDFSSTSASIGFVVPTSDNITWSALLDYAERAPSIEELYSNGPHLATQTFEIGDVNLDTESSANISVSFAYETDLFDAHITAYHNDFSDFIYQSATGDTEDGFPVFFYEQDNARFTGLDVELGVHLQELAGGDLDLRLTFDTVTAKIDGSVSENLPRIPANRIGAELVWDNAVWRAKVSFSDVSGQKDVAPFELRTEGYQDVSAKIERSFSLGGDNAPTFTAFIQGRNLTDEEQRAHTSFVKDFVPAPGRRIEAGLRFSF